MSIKRVTCRAALVLMTIWAAQTSAHDGEVNITGSIVDKTCTVSADSKSMVVTLGTVSSKQFARAGDGSRYEPFTLHLEKCGDAASNVSVTFIGDIDANNSELLAIKQVEGSATGIGIAIYDREKNIIPLNEAGESTPLIPYQTMVTLEFYARYLANGEAVSPGSANAATVFRLNYA